MVVGSNFEALAAKRTFPDGAVDRLTCCGLLKTEALSRTLNGEGQRLRFNHDTHKYEVEQNPEPFTGVIVVPGRMKRDQDQKNGIFQRETARTNGILPNNHLNSGTNIKPISHRERMCEFIHYWIGPN